MKTFLQWLEEFHSLDERGARTALEPGKPAIYGAGAKPPLAFTPTSATAALAFTTRFKDLLKNLRGAKKKTKKKKGRKKKD